MADSKTPEPAAATAASPDPTAAASAAPVSPPAPTSSPPAAQQTDENLLPGAHWTQQPQDDHERDSVYSEDEEPAESTASMSSSVLRYRTIMGRTYHSERGNAQYWGSNDEKQNESMDMNHHLLTLVIGDKLHLAPLGDRLTKVVDIGTGTGMWAIDFADEHPECSVIGTDISPIQPSWIPPNLEFQIDDCTQEWTFGEKTLDFVHMRYLTGSIIDWNQLFVEAHKSLKSGGWVESLEASPYIQSDDGTVADDSALGQWGKLFVAGSKKLGRTFTMVDDGLQRSGMEAAGFVDIDEFNMKVPFGHWPKDPKLKEMGRFSRATIDRDIEGYVSFMADFQGWTKEEVMVYAAQMRRELKNSSIHSFFHVRVVWGRKP